MSDEFNKQDYEQKIAELEKQLEEAKTQKTNDDTFDDLKQKYEQIIKDKDKELNELNKTLEETNKKVDSTVTDLNDEIQARLEATEEYKKLMATVQQLEEEKAEASVDAVIQKGLAMDIQRQELKDWCKSNPESFVNYFNKAQPIIEVNKQKSKKINADISRIRDYLKK